MRRFSAKFIVTSVISLAGALLCINARSAEARTSIDYGVGIDIYFNRGEITISDAQRIEVSKKIKDAISRFPNGVVCAIIVGHSEIDEGTPSQIISLAHDRAISTVNLLAVFGIPNEMIKSIAVGTEQAIAEQPNRRNSRVEVELRQYCR